MPLGTFVGRGRQLASNGMSCLMEFGLCETLFRLLRATGIASEFHSVDLFILEEQSVPDRASLSDRALKQGIVFGEVRQDEALAEDAIATDWLTDEPGALRRYFSQGSRLFVAAKDGQPVASQWANDHVADLSYIARPRVLLPRGHAYLHGAMTSPKCRGQGIGTTLRHLIARTLFEEGASHCVSAALLSNRGAQRWHRQTLQETYWGRISYIHVLGKRYWFKFLSAAGRNHPRLFDHCQTNTPALCSGDSFGS